MNFNLINTETFNSIWKNPEASRSSDLSLFLSLSLLRSVLYCAHIQRTHKRPCAFVGIVNAWRCVTSGPHCKALSRAATAERYLIWTSCKPTVILNEPSTGLSFSILFLFLLSCVRFTCNIATGLHVSFLRGIETLLCWKFRNVKDVWRHRGGFWWVKLGG